jgi:hypothetical protein
MRREPSRASPGLSFGARVNASSVPSVVYIRPPTPVAIDASTALALYATITCRKQFVLNTTSSKIIARSLSRVEGRGIEDCAEIGGTYM